MAQVRLEGLGKRFDRRRAGIEAVAALEPTDLTIDDGRFVVFVGPSGSGKTTALRIIAGLEPPTTGRVFIGDRDVTMLPPRERDVAMVFQSYALFPHLTVFENLAFGLRLAGLRPPEIRERVAAAAEELELEPLLSRFPRQLSGGQRQRVAVGRAIVRQPQVYLMDEPLSNLDAKLRAQTRVGFRRLHERHHTTTIYVTHDQTEAMTLGETIVVLHDGVIQQVATPEELYRHPRNAFVARFIGSPPMNLLEVEVRDGATGPAFASDQIDLPVPTGRRSALASGGARRLLLGVRPEDLHLDAGSNGDRSVVRGQTDFIEYLGPSTLVHVRVGGQELVGKFAGEPFFTPGSPLSLHLDLANVQLFDPGTGLNLDASA
ncbi:MAG: ABC transporter ATP-binding protein [Chloroflexi bacterium]|nr:ABC transporter ATP-binding protein [Chloroflexota bacterium]